MSDANNTIKDLSYSPITIIDQNKNDNGLVSFMDKEDDFINDPTKLTADDAYQLYKSDPSKKNLSTVLKSLNSTINYSLVSNNAISDPLLASRAKLIAAKAIKSFDPGYKVSLPTYVSSQLRKMTRIARDTRNAVKIPERYIYDSQNLNRVESELASELGRDPTLTELADASNLSIKKIADIRKQQLKQVSESQRFDNAANDENTASSLEELNQTVPDFLDEAEEYVYNTLDTKQKKMFEHLTGFGGSKLLTPDQISKKFNISESQISRNSKRFAKDIEDVYNVLESVYAK